MSTVRKITFIFILFLFLFSVAAAEGNSTVIYFSCTGTTEQIAQWIAEETGSDICRILPEEPYTEDDLKYYTDCRADREQADDTARPAIANMPESLEDYDTVFLGYPIWHGKAPKIMYTLLEGTELAGKTIIPFCTSASSPIGNSAVLLQNLTDDSAKWLEGKRFGKSAGKDEITAWVKSLELPAWSRKIYITVGKQSVTAMLSDNASAKAFYALLQQGSITINMTDYGSFEKVGPLGTGIVRSDEKITTTPGDIILYQGDKVTIYYAENTYTFTRLGHIDGATGENMKAFLGDGDPTVTFSIEETTPEEPDPPFSGLQNDGGTWHYYEDGVIQTGFSGLYYDPAYGWWLIAEGRLCSEYTGLWNDPNYGWWLIGEGRLCSEYNGLWGDQNYGWWLIKNGTIDFGYTGLWNDPDYGWWLIAEGRLCSEYTGLWNDPDYGWWLIAEGRLCSEYTGLWNDPAYGWWLIAEGRLCAEYTGLWDDPSYGWWLIAEGRLCAEYTGPYDEFGATWNIVNGQLAF